MLPTELESAVRACLSQKLNSPVKSLRSSAVGGGSINYSYRIDINNEHSFFCKVNSREQFPSLFKMEKMGLEMIESKNVIRVPKVIACTEVGYYQVLILEWIEQGPKTEKFWKLFGEQLAQLHFPGNSFWGLDEDNYMGSMRQSNKKNNSWTDFFIYERLMPQVSIALKNGLLESAHASQFEKMYSRMQTIFPADQPSFIHGDLWNGNLMADQQGEPVLIDPAVYWGHRNMDLGMTVLFGGFDKCFYEAYQHHILFPKNYYQQWEVCNLYPLLIHLNLFGSGYLRDIVTTINKY